MVADLLAKTIPTRPQINLERGGGFVFYASLAIFLLLTATYGGLFLLNRAQEAARAEFLAALTEKEAELGTGLVDQIFTLDRGISSIQKLASEHVFASNVFKLLEANVHPQVRFDSFAFSAEQRRVDLTGEATSYTVVARQVSIMEADPLVERVEFGGLATRDVDRVGFRMSVVFKDTLLRLK